MRHPVKPVKEQHQQTRRSFVAPAGLQVEFKSDLRAMCMATTPAEAEHGDRNCNVAAFCCIRNCTCTSFAMCEHISGRPADVYLLVIIVLGDNGDLVGHQVGGVETHAKLSNHGNVRAG